MAFLTTAGALRRGILWGARARKWTAAVWSFDAAQNDRNRLAINIAEWRREVTL
jgi:hypothetical protein